MFAPVFFPVRPVKVSLTGIMSGRTALLIPFARFERGSEVVAVKLGFTRFHAIKRVIAATNL